MGFPTLSGAVLASKRLHATRAYFSVVCLSIHYVGTEEFSSDLDTEIPILKEPFMICLISDLRPKFFFNLKFSLMA